MEGVSQKINYAKDYRLVVNNFIAQIVIY